jgi:hypothetical protein
VRNSFAAACCEQLHDHGTTAPADRRTGLVHGLEAYGAHFVGATINCAAEAAAHALPFASGPAKWAIMAALSGGVGLLIGAVSIPLIGFAIAPTWKLLKNSSRKREG